MAPPIDLPAAQWDALRAAYADPPRHYHGFAHVQEMLRHHAAVASGPGWQQPVETWLAALYHDAVYVAGRRDNEERSARLARDHATHWLPRAAIDLDRVAALIGMTARHGQITVDDLRGDPRPADAMHFLDCDMAILGAGDAAFDAYDRGIAAEYAHVPAPLFQAGRRRFLADLLARERIFLSDFFHVRHDVAARRNLARRLAIGAPSA